MEMDVLLGSLPVRPLSRQRPLPNVHPMTSSADGWTESVDLLRVPLPEPYLTPTVVSTPPAHHPASSNPYEMPDNRVLRVSTSANKTHDEVKVESRMLRPREWAGGDGDVMSSCRACRQQEEGRQTEGLYYHYHHNPFCRACQDTAAPSNSHHDDGSLCFGYLKYPAEQPARPTPKALPTCSPYSARGTLIASRTGSQQPYTRVNTLNGVKRREGERTTQGSDNHITARRRFLRFPSDFLFRFSGGGSASKTKTTAEMDSSLVEGKAEAYFDRSADGGRALVTKNRCSGEGECRRYKSQRLLMLAVFLLVLFLMTAASVLGVVLVWTPMQTTAAAASLATNWAGSRPNADVNQVTEEDNVQYITVSPSLERAEPDNSGWAFYTRGSLKGSKYTVINKPLTFYSAQERCQKLGGYLVHINTLREQLFLEDFLTQELERQGASQDSGIGFWIGAKRARGSHEGTCMFEQWKWVDAYGRALSTIAGVTAFVPGKPDNQYNPEECLFMSYRERTDENRFLKWDDAPCDLNSIGTIKALCEVEIR